MQMRKLGRTNFKVSAVGFGGIPIQKVDEKKAVEIIKASLENNINFIDTARAYTKSEELIGYGIKETGRENWIIATKSPARTYEDMKKDIEISLKELDIKCIDLYQMHNVKTAQEYEKVMSPNGALKALKEAKANGLIKEIGITSHTLAILEDAIETGEFSTIQFPYNPVEPQAEGLFKRADELDIGVIVMKPVAGGAITNVEYSIRYILENENVSTVIPGMDSIEHIKANTAVANPFRRLTDEERDIIMQEAKQLGTEFCRRCGYCAPCPQGIDIPTQFILEAYLMKYDLEEWSKSRYNGQAKTAKDCIECGACEPKCPYDLPIRKMLNRVSKNFG
ncbi:aldo/keto reductase [Clostridiaceae bacterium M8S5]|nr:aldo/keto reductase [Clostridiaceae bacterium M8S5]